MNQRKVSARYYLFEDVLWEMPGFTDLRKPRALADLQQLAALVWVREAKSGTCPFVKAKPTNDYSYFNHTSGDIHLARKHRCIGGLLHEIAHALGTRDKLTHGPAFRKRCLRLYKTYGDWNGEVE